jgi:hypothetical protein
MSTIFTDPFARLSSAYAKYRPRYPCYVGTSGPEGLVSAEYVDRMVTLSERFGFPRWYTERLAAYRPT